MEIFNGIFIWILQFHCNNLLFSISVDATMKKKLLYFYTTEI